MGQILNLHPVTPQGRFLDRAAQVLSESGIVVLPTDTCYALVATPGDSAAIERIARIRQFDGKNKLLSLIVPDLAGIATYAKVDNASYRLLRRYLPGPYTFILPATREVPKILGVRRQTIGLRVPDHAVVREVALRAGGVLFASTLELPGDERPLSEPDEIAQRIGPLVDLILTQGAGGIQPSTVVDLTGESPAVLRVGIGDPTPFQS